MRTSRPRLRFAVPHIHLAAPLVPDRMLGPDELYLVFQHLHRALEAAPFERADTRTALACCLAGGSPELLERSRALLYSRVVLRLYDVSQIDNLGKSLRSPHLASLIRRVDTRFVAASKSRAHDTPQNVGLERVKRWGRLPERGVGVSLACLTLPMADTPFQSLS